MKPRMPRWALLATMALVAACGGAAGDGGDGGEAAAGSEGQAAGEPIIIGALFDLSGATADVGTPYSEGMRDYVEWRNGEGGVEGRDIQLEWNDYQYEVPIAEQFYSQYVSQGAVAIQGWGTGDTEALRTRVTSDELPFMSASYAETLVNPEETPYNFVVALSYSDQMRLALQHIAEQTPGARVAVFHHDSPFGESPLADGQSYIEENGLDITYSTVAMPTGATDYVGELSQAGQVDYVIIQNVSSPAAQLARDVATQQPDATVFCLNWCGDELFVELAGDAAEGSLGVLPFGPPAEAEGELENVSAFLESQDRSVDDVGLHYTQGWYTMAVMAAGLEQVAASGEEITGPALKEALEAMEPIETPVSSPVDFTADSHRGMTSGRVYEVTDGAWEPITDELTP